MHETGPGEATPPGSVLRVSPPGLFPGSVLLDCPPGQSTRSLHASSREWVHQNFFLIWSGPNDGERAQKRARDSGAGLESSG